jgi:RNA polymerase primary sigma factor
VRHVACASGRSASGRAQILHIVVDKCGCRARTSSRFPGNETDLDWAEKIAAEGHSYSAVLSRNIPAIREQQQRLLDLQARVVLPLKDLKEINRRWRPAN